jgi:hypothetical protein
VREENVSRQQYITPNLRVLAPTAKQRRIKAACSFIPAANQPDWPDAPVRAQNLVTVPLLVSGQKKLRACHLTCESPATFCLIVILSFGALGRGGPSVDSLPNCDGAGERSDVGVGLRVELLIDMDIALRHDRDTRALIDLPPEMDRSAGF